LNFLSLKNSQGTLTMVAHGWMKDLFNYDSPKLIRFPSVGCVCVKWFIYGVIAVYICYTLIVHKRYQEKEELTSSVRINLKGVAHADRIWDAAEYTIPTQTRDSFFVMTNVIRTDNQIQQTCPEYPIAKAICSSDKSCEKGIVNVHSNGIQTGRCVRYNATYKTCEIKAWCPVQMEESPPVPAVLRSSEDFTVLIKNNIHFPTFNYTVQNISPKLNTSCKFNKVTDPLCPIFRLGDILQEAKENFSEVAVKGGIIAIEIKWDCDLDRWSYYCSPEYSFRRLDDKTRTQYPGFILHCLLSLLLSVPTAVHVLAIPDTGNLYSCCMQLQGIVAGVQTAETRPVVRSLFCLQFCEQLLELTVLISSASQVMFVSYVDKPHITLIKMPLETSLQNAEGSSFENHPVKFYDPRTCCTHENENHSTAQSELRLLTQSISSAHCPEWCCCGQCQVTQKYHEQLCCRKKEGQCITTTYWFTQLVLSRDTLNKALLYEDPFLDLTGHRSNSQLRRIAYKQFIHWRFGSFELEDRAIIPSCCRRLIRNTYPKANGNYTGFNLE
uniref:P2X purinoceptor n=1 Tax=Chrysolophus pictus TaxID=9089 RepID=A0A8C3PX42_CHRPC